jgi:cell division protein FtsI/penicillin-binding protein 2
MGYRGDFNYRYWSRLSSKTTPLQLCLMTAQLANGGYKIYPKITSNDDDVTV